MSHLTNFIQRVSKKLDFKESNFSFFRQLFDRDSKKAQSGDHFGFFGFISGLGKKPENIIRKHQILHLKDFLRESLDRDSKTFSG